MRQWGGGWALEAKQRSPIAASTAPPAMTPRAMAALSTPERPEEGVGGAEGAGGGDATAADTATRCRDSAELRDTNTADTKGVDFMVDTRVAPCTHTHTAK